MDTWTSSIHIEPIREEIFENEILWDRAWYLQDYLCYQHVSDWNKTLINAVIIRCYTNNTAITGVQKINRIQKLKRVLWNTCVTWFTVIRPKMIMNICEQNNCANIGQEYLKEGGINSVFSITTYFKISLFVRMYRTNTYAKRKVVTFTLKRKRRMSPHFSVPNYKK